MTITHEVLCQSPRKIHPESVSVGQKRTGTDGKNTSRLMPNMTSGGQTDAGEMGTGHPEGKTRLRGETDDRGGSIGKRIEGMNHETGKGIEDMNHERGKGIKDTSHERGKKRNEGRDDDKDTLLPPLWIREQRMMSIDRGNGQENGWLSGNVSENPTRKIEELSAVPS